MKNNYLDSVANAHDEVKAWKLASCALGVVAIALTIGIVIQARNAPVILVPAAFAQMDGLQTVKPNGNFAKENPDFLVTTALGDLATVLNWTPEDVEIQTKRFLNRMTADLYAEQNSKLLGAAADYKSASYTQSFYPSESKVSSDGSVAISGTLVRWTGEKEIFRTPVKYVISYASYKGYLHVSALRIQN